MLSVTEKQEIDYDNYTIFTNWTRSPAFAKEGRPYAGVGKPANEFSCHV